MRIRTVKPSFYKDEVLASLDEQALGRPGAYARVLFEGLWSLADVAGRLADRPKRIAADVLPYDQGVDVEALLVALDAHGFIVRYTVGDKRCIWIPGFLKHQRLCTQEKLTTSDFPPCPREVAESQPVQTRVKPKTKRRAHRYDQEGKGVGKGVGKGKEVQTRESAPDTTSASADSAHQVTDVREPPVSVAPLPAQPPTADARQTHSVALSGPIGVASVAEDVRRPDAPQSPPGAPQPTLALVVQEPPEAPVLVYPVQGTPQTWALMPAQVRRFEDLWPGVDVLRVCRRALAWAETNPKKRPRASSMPSWLNGVWLGKEQDATARPTTGQRYGPAPPRLEGDAEARRRAAIAAIEAKAPRKGGA